MFIKPDLKDEKIIICLRDAYALAVEKIAFLPLGADFNTAVYRVTTSNGEDYFFKLRRGDFLEAHVSIPKYLADMGIKQVISPLATNTGQLWASLASFKAILYPYIEGHNGVEVKLSDQQWVQFGVAMKSLHSMDIPSAITKGVPREAFSSKWRETVKAFLVRIENDVYENHICAKTAEFLKSKSSEIREIIERTDVLASKLQNQSPAYVLCHADIHGWNLMIDANGALYIVDWDTLIFAPKERDLMFVGGGIWESGRLPEEEEVLFYQGYGPTNINPDAVCYYRFERIIQDIGEYCEHIFSFNENDVDRLQSFDYLESSFRANGPMERACQSFEGIAA